MDEFCSIVYGWGHRYWVEGAATLALFLVIHFLAYPYVIRRHDATTTTTTPPSSRTDLLPETVTPSAPKKSQIEGQVADRSEADGMARKTHNQAPPPRTMVQNAPNGIAIGGDNSGTAVVNNYGPRPLAITSAQMKAVAVCCKPYAGSQVSIIWEYGSSDTDVFVRSLKGALEEAGLVVSTSQAAIAMGPRWLPTHFRSSIRISCRRQAVG